MPDTAPVRSGEELDTASLSKWLGEEVQIEQFPGGHSNLTYLLRTKDAEYVLRRAPMGPVPPKAHDMAREYGILKAIHTVFPPAPNVVRLCEDFSVIGAVFFLMERRCGVIWRNPAEVTDPALRARLSESFVDTLVRLHAVDLHSNGLLKLGRPEGFLERQVSGWSDRWQRADTPDRPDMSAVMKYLATTLPVSPAPSIVHNDYKLDNVMFRDDGAVAAVLDWEMTTIGDPVADLGLTLCYWSLGGAYGAAEGEGWHSREQIVARYAAATGRDVGRVGWYETLGVFKLAVILQQIYVRYVRGQTNDERFAEFNVRIAMLAERARTLAERRA